MSDISDLTTLEDVKAWIDPTPNDSEDEFLSQLIVGVSNDTVMSELLELLGF